MRTSISVGTSAAVAAVFTHGLVISALNFNDAGSISDYRGFFRHIITIIEQWWSSAHGWIPLSHIREFGPFFAPTLNYCAR